MDPATATLPLQHCLICRSLVIIKTVCTTSTCFLVPGFRSKINSFNTISTTSPADVDPAAEDFYYTPPPHISWNTT